MPAVTFVTTVPVSRTLTIAVPDEIAWPEVEVTVLFRPVPTGRPATAEEWQAFIDRSAGSLPDPTFCCPAQPDLPEAPILP